MLTNKKHAISVALIYFLHVFQWAPFDNDWMNNPPTTNARVFLSKHFEIDPIHVSTHAFTHEISHTFSYEVLKIFVTHV